MPSTPTTPRFVYRRISDNPTAALSTITLESKDYASDFISSQTMTETSSILIRVGVICHEWPFWVHILPQSVFRVSWILYQDLTFLSSLKQVFGHIRLDEYTEKSWTSVEEVDILLCNGPLDIRVPLTVKSIPLVLFDWNFRGPRSFRNHFRWTTLKLSHVQCGGVSTGFFTLTLLVRSGCANTFDTHDLRFDTSDVLAPALDVGSVISCTEPGKNITRKLEEELVNAGHGPLRLMQYSDGTFYHRGLFPWLDCKAEFRTPFVIGGRRLVKRCLVVKELWDVCDLPGSLRGTLAPPVQWQLLQSVHVPGKVLSAVITRLFLTCDVSFESTFATKVRAPDTALAAIPVSGEGNDVITGGDTFSSPSNDLMVVDVDNTVSDKVPPNWLLNEGVTNAKQDAVQHDDAAVPLHLWYNMLCIKLGVTSLSAAQQSGLGTLRHMLVHRIWKRRVTKCFCAWLRCAYCHEISMKGLFRPHDKEPRTTEIKGCSRCTSNRRIAVMKSKVVRYVSERKCYEWRKGGRKIYRTWFDDYIIRKNDNSEDRRRDILAGRDCIERVGACSDWKWNNGSRLFFWRWGEFKEDVRDGAPIYHYDKLPNCKKPQPPPKDPNSLSKVQTKLNDVRRKRYIEKGPVKSVTSFFDVPKGDDDIRMVYNGTSSGLNDSVWCPWFALPTVESELRAIVADTVMADCDISEMFLNFMLDEKMRPFAGVDFTRIFPDEAKEGSKEGILWERWARMLMGFKPSPYLTTRDMMKRMEGFLKGDRKCATNPFRWNTIVLNLPGMKKYDPSLPWVFKARLDNKVAGDLFIYIDDLRCTGTTEIECWDGAHQVSCRLSWLGIQDAPRKRREASKEAGAWAGTVVHTSQGHVTVLVSEKKWKKTQDWIQWLFDELEKGEGLDHKKLLSCRGFLIYVARTYRPFRPYLRGLHKTIDAWRPGRDKDRWKLTQTMLQIQNNMEVDLDTGPLDLPPEKVQPVSRLKEDVKCLIELTSFAAPPKVIRRSSKCGVVLYGFGDASGRGFGHAISIDGHLHTEFGQWSPAIEEKHSNYKELRNLVNAVDKAHSLGALHNAELFLFTDNFVAECAYFNGGSNKSKELDALVFQLWKLQMSESFILHVIHVAGTRMIECGVDGLSRGDKNEGVMKGVPLLAHVPIHLSPVERSSRLLDWIRGWWPSQECGHLKEMKPVNWFDDVMEMGNFLWTVPPAAGEAAVEQLCSHVHGRPHNSHIFIIPRLCTANWRKQLGKVCDCLITLPVGHECWPINMHEPLLMGIYLPLLPCLPRFSPWKLRETVFMERFERKLRLLQSTGEYLDGDLLRKLFIQAFELPTMSNELARRMLQEKSRR